MLYRALSLSLLFSLYSHAADQKNNDRLISEAGGNWTEKPVITGTTSMVPIPQMPEGVEIEPQFIGTNRPITSHVGSSAGGSIFNFLTAFVRPSEKELKRDREIEELNKQLTRAMTKTGTQQIGGIPRPQEDLFSPSGLAKMAKESAQIVANDPLAVGPSFINGKPVATPAPAVPYVAPSEIAVVTTPTVLSTTSLVVTSGPAPVIAAPTISSSSAPLVPKFVATKSLTFTNGTAKNTDFLDLDNSQKMAETAEKFASSIAAPSPLQNSSESNNGSGSGLVGLVGGGALLTQAATAPAAPAAAVGGGTVATTSWGATMGGYAVAAAPWVAVGTGAFAVGIGIGMIRDRIFYPELSWWPTQEERAAVYAKHAAEKAKQAQKVSNNSPTPSGSHNPKKPDDNRRDRIVNQVQRTEAMDKIKENYRYDKQTNLYKLKDNGTPIKCTRTGKDVINVKWDGAHNDIEALNKRFQHMGSLDPVTFKMYKGPEIGRQEL